MQSEEADDVFEKDDEKLRQAELKRHEGKEERSTVFRTQYRDLRKRVSAAAAAKARPAAKGRGRGRAAAAGSAAHAKAGAQFPAELAPHQLTLQWLQEWMPPGGRLQRDTYNGRWECNVFGVRRGRAWRLYGPQGSAREILKVAWEIAGEHGVGVPFRW